MGARGVQIYQFTNELLVAATEYAAIDQKNAMWKRAQNFAKKHGLYDKEFCVTKNYGLKDGCGIVGMTPYEMRYRRWAPPKKYLDQTIWMKSGSDRFPPMWRPKKTPAAKKIRAQWDAIGRWDMVDVVSLIDWKDIYDDESFPMRVYFFSPWWFYGKSGKFFCGFSHSLPADRKQDYKPPKGLMKRLTYEQYEKLEKENVTR